MYWRMVSNHDSWKETTTLGETHQSTPQQKLFCRVFVLKSPLHENAGRTIVLINYDSCDTMNSIIYFVCGSFRSYALQCPQRSLQTTCFLSGLARFTALDIFFGSCVVSKLCLIIKRPLFGGALVKILLLLRSGRATTRLKALDLNFRKHPSLPRKTK